MMATIMPESVQPALVDHAAAELQANYAHLRKLSTASAVVAISMVVGGFVVLAMGVLFLFRGETEVGALTTASGLIIEFITAVPFRFYRNHFEELRQRSHEHSDKWSLYTAYRLCNELNANDRDRQLNRIINKFSNCLASPSALMHTSVAS